MNTTNFFASGTRCGSMLDVFEDILNSITEAKSGAMKMPSTTTQGTDMNASNTSSKQADKEGDIYFVLGLVDGADLKITRKQGVVKVKSNLGKLKKGVLTYTDAALEEELARIRETANILSKHIEKGFGTRGSEQALIALKIAECALTEAAGEKFRADPDNRAVPTPSENDLINYMQRDLKSSVLQKAAADEKALNFASWLQSRLSPGDCCVSFRKSEQQPAEAMPEVAAMGNVSVFWAPGHVIEKNNGKLTINVPRGKFEDGKLYFTVAGFIETIKSINEKLFQFEEALLLDIQAAEAIGSPEDYKLLQEAQAKLDAAIKATGLADRLYALPPDLDLSIYSPQGDNVDNQFSQQGLDAANIKAPDAPHKVQEEVNEKPDFFSAVLVGPNDIWVAVKQPDEAVAWGYGEWHVMGRAEDASRLSLTIKAADDLVAQMDSWLDQYPTSNPIYKKFCRTIINVAVLASRALKISGVNATIDESHEIKLDDPNNMFGDETVDMAVNVLKKCIFMNYPNLEKERKEKILQYAGFKNYTIE